MKRQLQNVIDLLQQMLEDNTVPKNVRAKIDKTILLLQKDEEQKIKISRAMHELEEISNDTNMQSDTRTQIFNIISVLEVA
jgi:uncharacterized protein (UPF0147 family)